MSAFIRLADHTRRIGSGLTPLGGKSSYLDAGVPLIRSQNVLMGAFTREGLAFISPKQDQRMSASRVEAGDVLLNITGASIGRVCLAPDDICPANVNQHVCVIRCGESLDPQYLAAFLASPTFQTFIWQSQAGGTRQALTKEMIEAFEIPFRPLSEQRRIAAHVNTQLAFVEVARATGDARARDVEALRAAIYRDAFRHIAPVGGPPGLENTPDGWRWLKLADVARLESGHTPSRSRPDWWDGDVSWISLTEIRALDGRWVEKTELTTNEAGIANSAARILPRGTVCFSRTASVGFVAIMAKPMATSQDFANWVCGDQLDPEFLMYALIGSRAKLRALATGATHKTIYMPTLEAFHICMPDRAEQEAIVRRLKNQLTAIDELRWAAQAQLKDIELLPGRLLAQAFENL